MFRSSYRIRRLAFSQVRRIATSAAGMVVCWKNLGPKSLRQAQMSKKTRGTVPRIPFKANQNVYQFKCSLILYLEVLFRKFCACNTLKTV